MMQCGMPVCAESFHANVCSGLFTHYKKEEDASMQSGKLDEELGRMSSIVDQVRARGLVLCNESFGSTNEREGSEIGRQVVTALLEQGIKVLYVTHMYELAHGFWAKRMRSALFLRAQRLPDGERTFRIEEGQPLETSFAQDLYRRIFHSKPGEPVS
jgi:dsDNA-specific endonuclease/ATPase MutS2